MMPIVFLIIVAVFMISETALSRRHERTLRAIGSIEPRDDVYQIMRVVYPMCFLAILAEGLMRMPQRIATIAVGSAIFGAAKLVKFWVIRSLGARWTFRVLVPPGSVRTIRGPYRFLRHPNYLAILGELGGMAIACEAVISGSVAIIVFGLILRRRIAVEERALSQAFGPTSQTADNVDR